MSGIQDNYKLTNQTVISYNNTSTGSLINSSLTSVGNASVSRDNYVNLVRTTPNPNDYLKQISFVLEYSTQWIDLPNIYFLNNLVSSAVIHVSCSVLNNSDSSIYKSSVFEIFLKRIGSEWTSTSSFSGDLTGVVFKSSQAYDSIHGYYCKIQYKNTNNSDNYITRVDIKCKTISSFGTFKDSPLSGNYESFYTNLTNKTPNNFLLGDSSGNVVLQDIGITTNENDDVEISSNIVMNNNKIPVDVRGDTTVNRNLITTYYDKYNLIPGLYTIIYDEGNGGVGIDYVQDLKPSTKFERNTAFAENFSYQDIATTGIFPNDNNQPDNINVQWVGYFIPIYTGNWTFYIRSDNDSKLWIGDSAINATSHNFNLTVRHTQPEQNYSVNMTAGTKYPIRLIWSEEWGGNRISFGVSGPNFEKSYDLTGLVFSNKEIVNLLLSDYPKSLANIGNDLDSKTYTYARYIKIQRNADGSRRSYAHYNQLNILQIEIYDENNVNIAPNGIATQSSTYGHYKAEYAIDGSLTTMAHTYGEYGSDSWIQIDLGENKLISRVVIYNRVGMWFFFNRFSGSLLKLIDQDNNVIRVRKVETYNPNETYEFKFNNDLYTSADINITNDIDKIILNTKEKYIEYQTETSGIFFVDNSTYTDFYFHLQNNEQTVPHGIKVNNGIIIHGWYIGLKLPTLQCFKEINILNSDYRSPDRCPEDISVLASNDDTNWDLLYITTGLTWPYRAREWKRFQLSNNSSYLFYRLVIMKHTGSNVSEISEIYFKDEQDRVWPPVALIPEVASSGDNLTANISGEEYGNGNYIISRSSSYSSGSESVNRWAYRAFDKIISSVWSSAYYSENNYPSSVYFKDLVVCNVYGGLRFRTQKEKDSIPDMIISSSGNFGLGIEEPGFLLELSKDSAYNTNNSVWDTLSDISVKKNVENADLQICLDNIKNIPLKTWTLKKELADIYIIDLNRTSLGVTAQDTESILPKSIRTTKKKIGNLTYEDFKYLDSDQIFWNLYGGVQNLVSRVQNILNKI